VNQLNPVKSGTTDGSGVVTFNNLSSQKYFWFASLYCENNINGSFANETPIKGHTTTKITTVLSSTGTIQYVNNSKNSYTAFVNGKQFGIVPGNSTIESRNMPIGSYSVRILQNDGYILSPTDETVTGSITCGGTLTVTCP
jgi:hypothetical protein